MAATLLLLLFTACAGARLGDLARRDTGDIFTLIGDECNASQCAEHGAGAGARGVAGCACACPQRAPLFREDRELCVDDLPECSLATFGTGTGVQRIPFVYLPLKGQIIHPSREITFQNVKTPICAVSGAQFLTRKGFLDLRNTLDADVPFKLFRDEGRTFIQWSGEDEVRTRMSGRVMVVRLLCRDVDATPTSPLDLRGVFTPCVAFRVQGTPPKHYSNVTEVQFAPNAQTSDTNNTSGLSLTEYVAIGISALLLGLIYVASVFLFLHIRKRRKAASDEGSRRLQGIKKKDGSSITERDIVRVNNERIQTLPNSARQDDGVIKKNPLLNINRQYQESKSCLSDSGSNFSDSEDFTANSSRSDENIYNNHTIAAIVHQHHNEMSTKNDNMEICHRDESSIERLPHEHVSIVETTDDREITRPVGTTRRKLYFNPSYFEPKLMAEPPPAALEFLVKIREVIAIAKHKMATKRFQPVLNQIPEEETYPSNGNSLDFNQRLGSQRSESIVSLKRENSRRKNCVGCPGCQPEGTNDMTKLIKHNIPTCLNCQNNGKGDKQNIIRKWLENIPTAKQTYNECLSDANQNNMENSPLSHAVIDNENHKISNQNTFQCTDSMYFTNDFSVTKGQATVSVRSDPLLQNYNLPLPEFENVDYRHNDYYQTVGKGLSHYCPDSFRNTDSDVNTLICNKNALPDMVNEAIALEHCYKSYNECSSVEEKFHNIILNTNNRNVLSVTRNITESPVGNDYETDSLERNSNKKGVSTLTEYSESPSSQASPSLSNALPLEEELTMRNAIYKTHSSSNSNTPSPHREICVDQNHYETIGKLKNPTEVVTASQTNEYSLVSEVYVNNNYNFGSTPTSPSSSECSLGSRKLNLNIKKSEEKPGCLTIEVKDSPENYIKIHESDDFEPDTLDRKQSKHKEIIDTIQFSRKDLIKNLDNNDSIPRQSIQLRSSGTFKKTNDRIEHSSKFHSLRNDYEQRKNSCDRPKLSSALFSGSKSLDEIADGTWDETSEWDTEDGRILTLELRHSKRQRQCTLPTINQLKNLARPDILPPLAPIDDDPIYEQPTFPPRRVEVDKTERGITSKNMIARSLNPRIFTNNTGSENIIGSSSVTTAESHCGPSCSSKRATVQSLSSEYDNVEPENISRKMDENCRNLYKRHLGNNCINTDTFVKGNRHESKPRFRRKKGSNVQDSGYLSSDSTNSQKVQRRIVVAKIVSCSESDDTENEARSESGAESIETHSVFFDHFRKPLITDEQYNNSTKSSRNFNRNHRRADDCNN